MPIDLDPQDPRLLAAGALVGVALVQLILARWRDLGPVTVAVAGGLAAVLPGEPTWGAVAVAALLAGVAWARGGRRGVGHPALVFVVFAVAVAVNGGLVAVALPEGAEIVGAAAIGVVGAALGAVALRRPGARWPPVRWLGEIPVR